jgi:DNA-directed RNA polymerase III subunit RPC2
VFRKNTTLIRKYPNGTYVRHIPERNTLLTLTRFDRLADAPVDETTKKKVKKYDIIDGDGLAMAGERVDPGDIYVNKQTPTNANDNTTVSAVAAGFKNTPLTYKAPVSGYIDKVKHSSYCEAIFSQSYT